MFPSLLPACFQHSVGDVFSGLSFGPVSLVFYASQLAPGFSQHSVVDIFSAPLFGFIGLRILCLPACSQPVPGLESWTLSLDCRSGSYSEYVMHLACSQLIPILESWAFSLDCHSGS